MSTKHDSFIVVPFNLLPSETAKDSTPAKVEEEREKIRDRILAKSNRELVEEDAQRPDDDKAMVLLREIGSDLNINAFALNFRYSDGTVNTDVEEANYLNRRVVERLSVDSPEDDPTSFEFFLTSTEFVQSQYGKCADTFKRRLQLEVDKTDLFVLRNVVMSPFPTDGNFIDNMVKVFRKVVEEEVEVRILLRPAGFYPCAKMPTHRSVASATKIALVIIALSSKALIKSILFIGPCSIWPQIVAS